MRKFSSYGPVDTDVHYYAPRKELLDHAYIQLLGENPEKGGHYITVWGPRQTGKTWVMQQAMWRLQRDERFDVVKINLQGLKTGRETGKVTGYLARHLTRGLGRKIAPPETLEDFEDIFARETLHKPLILILDEFDALKEAVIADLVNSFRNIHISRRDQLNRPPGERDYLLHGVALVGVRAVLGVENVRGSPFNVQRSMHIPNLTFDEVEGMFQWYEQESGQTVEPAVVERVFSETLGQPGLTCWFGELLTEKYNKEKDQPITMDDFEEVFADAIDVLPNNNIINIISRARQEPHRQFVLEMFRTDEKIPFKYDHPHINYLYLNGVIDLERTTKTTRHVKFACPFVQKRLFNAFSTVLFETMDRLYPPFESLDDTITEDSLNVANLLRRYERYLRENRDWLLKDAPRRSDLRLFEAVYHFNLYMFLKKFVRDFGGQVFPEFPTGNGKIDLLIRHGGQLHGLEVKSYRNDPEYRRALRGAAQYGQQLGLGEITLAFFVEAIDDANREKYERVYTDAETGVTVRPVFVATAVQK